jgi:hypothetical protein
VTVLALVTLGGATQKRIIFIISLIWPKGGKLVVHRYLLNFSLGICGLIFFGQMREVSPTQGDQGDYIQHNIAGVIVCDIAKASPM